MELKYVNMGVVFQEIPDETTLAINISNCPCKCKGCHSPYLWNDEGTVLDEVSLDTIMSHYRKEVTCVCFMGGDVSPESVNRLAGHLRHFYPEVKIAWYSGSEHIAQCITPAYFDFIKVGPFIEERGGLNSKTTNQRLYKITEKGGVIDITCRFWK